MNYQTNLTGTEKFIIHGGRSLRGSVRISGSKNASLPILTATLLAPGEYHIRNVPNLRDVETMINLLQELGVPAKLLDHSVSVSVGHEHGVVAPYELVSTMRASFYVLGPLLAKQGRASVSLPGGCAWGPRPVNLHIDGLRKMGAEIDIEEGYVNASCRRLHGAHIVFDVPSVGATGNLLMAAVLAKGDSILENAATEPEISQLAEFLLSMGARIKGLGTRRLEVKGVEELYPTDVEIIPDRIEAGTFLTAAAIAGGDVTLHNVNMEHLSAVISKLEQIGAGITAYENNVRITYEDRPRSANVRTDVYPGFPTDMQAQWTALMSVAPGKTTITDTIYHDRFGHVGELNRLGANIEVAGNAAIVQGVDNLDGAEVNSTDLRASASLILAGLVAKGTTQVLGIEHIDRGYERIEEKLNGLGAEIKREKR